jgi:hypothetical protein
MSCGQGTASQGGGKVIRKQDGHKKEILLLLGGRRSGSGVLDHEVFPSVDGLVLLRSILGNTSRDRITNGFSVQIVEEGHGLTAGIGLNIFVGRVDDTVKSGDLRQRERKVSEMKEQTE